MIEESVTTSTPSPLLDQPAAGRPAGRAPANGSRTSRPSWQERLLPYMLGSVLVFAGFFFVATVVQLAMLTNSIGWRTDQEADSLHQDLAVPPALAQPTADQALAAYRFQALARLDLYLLQRRYHEANVLLMAGVWVRYLGFVTGMMLALLGAVFILGKLREPMTKFSGEAGGVKGAFEGTSPGMLMVVLGSVLMLATILSRQQYGLTDTAVFTPLGTQGITITSPAVQAAEPPAAKPILPTPSAQDAKPTPGTGPAVNSGK